MNDNKKLLVECMTFDADISLLKESINNPNKPFRVRGLVQRKGTINQNGRSYPDRVLEKSTQDYINTFVRQTRALGELDHASDEVVNLKNVSHNIVDLKWNGNDLIADIDVLTTPSGNILRELFKCGISVGISSRGTGSVKKISESTVVVNDDYSIICWDFVSNPSVQGAFMSPVETTTLAEGIIKNPINNQWVRTDELIHNILSELN
jgi:hypothetical protein